MSKKKAVILRLSIYFTGLFLLAAGVTLSAKVSLGVSPIISVACSISDIFDLNLGNATFVWYALFVAFEILVHLMQKIPDKARRIRTDLLQLPLNLLFTRAMNIVAVYIPVFATEFPDSFPGTIACRILLLLIAFVFIGVGAAMSLDAQVVPNPADGIVQTLSDLTGTTVGTMKNVFDICCVGLTVMISLVSGRWTGIGVGTVLAMLGIGRVIAVFNRFCLAKIQAVNEISRIL